MKTSLDVNGADVNKIHLDTKTSEALSGLDELEAHFVIQKVREQIPLWLWIAAEEWYREELEKQDCDMAKVGRLVQACRKLDAVQSR